LGFFSGKAENLKVYVNGEAVLAIKDKGRDSRFQHSAGNVSGLTMSDFIALPAKARVSVSYDGEKPAEGFFSLRKL
jgi:hypothetical protein